MTDLPGWKDKALFTPGPLTTSRTVKQAMLRDMGSRDTAFIQIVREIRDRLNTLAGGEDSHTAIPMQGSGTFGIESVIGSVIPPDGKLLVAINGAYGRRIAGMAKMLNIGCVEIVTPENQPIDPGSIDHALQNDSAITHVAVVHCETTTGILNPIQSIGDVAHRHGRACFVDAMSSFGAVPIDVKSMHIDYLVSSANKCTEGVPGFSFVIANQNRLAETAAWARSMSLDLHAQWQGLEQNGQFRFTPPTHAILAFHQALAELEQEGGVEARARRYAANHEALVHGMRLLGFVEYLDPALQGYIITSFRMPEHNLFSFENFYGRLSDRGVLIYPGKVSDAECFRIGTIGRLQIEDIHQLLAAVRCVIEDMEVELPGRALDVLTEL